MENWKAKKNLPDMAASIAKRSVLTQSEAETLVRHIFDIVSQYLKSDRIVKIKGFGTFKAIEVSGRDSVDVNTGERIHISGHSKISFTPDTILRDQINRPFADFETIVINEGVDTADMERLPNDKNQNEETSKAEIADTIETATVAEEIIEDDADSDTSTTEPEEVLLEEQAGENSVEEISPELPEETESEEEETESQVLEAEIQEETPNQEEEVIIQEKDVKIQEEVFESQEEKAESQEHETEPQVITQENTKEVENSTDEKTKSVQTDENPSEKVIYVERRPCHSCRICYILLLISLMSLSYLAGFQHWFGIGRPKFPPRMEYMHRPWRHNPSQKPTAQNDSLSSQTQEKATAAAELPDADNANNIDSCKVEPFATPKPEKADKSPSSLPSPSTTNKGTDAQPAVKQPAAQATPKQPAAQTTPKQAATQTTPRQPATEAQSNKKYEITGTRCIHTVTNGEGLYRIARKYYGNMNMVTYIIRYNNISNPDHVTVGMQLKIPELQEIKTTPADSLQ